MNKKTNNLERGIVKEILVVVAVIFILTYFNIDPSEV